MSEDSLYTYVVSLGDNSMILGHRLSELCGHGPSLETDMALTNISLDLFGEVRNLYQYAAQIKGEDRTEDTIAYNRHGREFYNSILVEQPNTDFAFVIVRQYFFDCYHKMVLHQLTSSKDKRLSEIAAKSLKEATYHQRFSSEWVLRLGGGTSESHGYIQRAVDELYPYIHELVRPSSLEKKMAAAGIAADLDKIKPIYYKAIMALLKEADLVVPETKERFAEGKKGLHSEHLDYILGEFQYMQRSYPHLQW